MSKAKSGLPRAAIVAALLAAAACQPKPTEATEATDPSVQRAEAAVLKALGDAQNVKFEEVAQCGDVADTAGGYVTGVDEKGAFQTTFMYVHGQVAFSDRHGGDIGRLTHICMSAMQAKDNAVDANRAEVNATMAKDGASPDNAPP